MLKTKLRIKEEEKIVNVKEVYISSYDDYINFVLICDNKERYSFKCSVSGFRFNVDNPMEFEKIV